MKPFINDLKSKIEIAIKNGIDVSELIKDVDLRNVNLSRAIIKKLQIRDRDISGCNFSNCILGDEGNIGNIPQISFINCKMNHCNFEGARFVSTSWIRSCDAQNCRFNNTDASKLSYANSNFMGSTFCGAIIRIETKEGIGCKFPVKMFEDLTSGWNMKIKAEYIN
jgi:uncharacterized protein YjbI with pentapeptide repeats